MIGDDAPAVELAGSGEDALERTRLALADAGAAGERLVARLRLFLTVALFAIALRGIVFDPGVEENYVGIVIAGTAVAVATALYALARRGHYRRWVAFATSALDVSLVSAGLAAFLVIGEPHTAVNSKVIFEAYFLAIAAGCLRYDRRVCLAAGALAVAQYGAIVGVAATRFDLNAPAYAPYVYGIFSWSAQVSRLALLATMTLLSAAIVARAERLRLLSAVDRLTGLFNRGYFDERFAEALSRARRARRPLSLALLDLDEFKRFNDDFGHEAGDVALRAAAEAVVGALRPGDLVARYGGEELVVLFPDTSPAAAAALCEQVRAAIAAVEVPVPRRATVGRLTTSAGVASWPADGDAGDELLYRADVRLFAAKHGGRNRVVGVDGPER